MLTNLTDEKLVELAVSRDSEAFGEIVRRWERKIFALCFGMLGREDEARDAAQETFIAAYRNISNFRGEAKVSSWLHRIAVNQCLTTKRRTKTRSEEFLGDETGGHVPAVHAQQRPDRVRRSATRISKGPSRPSAVA